MKIGKNLVLGAVSLFGGALAILSKNKAAQTVGLGVGITAGGYLLGKMFREESKKIETQCRETEEVFESSGLNPEKTETVSLLTTEREGETPVFAKVLLLEAINNMVLSDEELEYDQKHYLNTLHIMQNVEKNRLIVSIPLPPKSRGNLGPKEVREHYKKVFDEFIDDNKLDMKNYLNQIGVVVIRDNSDYFHYEEILREEDETFQEYLERINSYQGQKVPRGLVLNEGESFLRVEQYLNLEFPVFPLHSERKGLDIFSATKLIKMLTETAYIRSHQTGRETAFDLNRVAFHPSNDYGEILVVKEGSIVSVDL